jgi:hypothetical protein
LRRRSAVEPVIGHAKTGHRMGRNHLAGPAGDAANAVLSAAGYNFRRLLEWLRLLLCLFLAAFTPQPTISASYPPSCKRAFPRHTRPISTRSTFLAYFTVDPVPRPNRNARLGSDLARSPTRRRTAAPCAVRHITRLSRKAANPLKRSPAEARRLGFDLKANPPEALRRGGGR